MNILNDAKLLNDEMIVMIVMRRTLHGIPELGMNLPKSNKYITEQLNNLGYDTEQIGVNGITTTIGSGVKTILLRADYDALPIIEQADVEYKSTNGSMHACGHDIHASMLLGVAKILKKYEHELKCKVKILFQPGEETAEGALNMLEAGVIENVDEAYMIHVVSGKNVPSGKILTTRIGAAMATSCLFEIDIHGCGGHGSTPDLTVDPIHIASHIVINLQNIVSREVNVFNPTIISIGKFTASTAYNIIPNTANIQGTTRTFGRENTEFVKDRINTIARSTAEMYRGNAKVKIQEVMPSLIQDETVYTDMIKSANNLFSSKNVISIEEVIGTDMITGSEDFAFISEKVPTACIFLALGTGTDYGIHHPKVTFDESNMYMGTALLADIVLSKQ